MDMSSELIHSLLPLFMASGLGASMLTIGLVEGVAEATAAVSKVFSGTLSDWLGKRKLGIRARRPDQTGVSARQLGGLGAGRALC